MLIAETVAPDELNVSDVVVVGGNKHVEAVVTSVNHVGIVEAQEAGGVRSFVLAASRYDVLKADKHEYEHGGEA